jgi:hypothetical protein
MVSARARVDYLFPTSYLHHIRQSSPALQIVLVNSTAELRKLHLVLE